MRMCSVHRLQAGPSFNMPSTCCVLYCGSRSNRDKVKFFRLPTERNYVHRRDLNELSRKRRQEWLTAIRRTDLKEKKLDCFRVCSKHFISGKPSELDDVDNVDWVPAVALGYNNYVNKLQKQYGKVSENEGAPKRRAVIINDFEIPGTSEGPEHAKETEAANKTEPAKQHEPTEMVAEAANISSKNDKQCQTDITSEYIDQVILSLESSKRFESKRIPLMGYNFFKDDDVKTEFYTGISSLKMLEIVFSYLKDYVPVHFNANLPIFDQFLLTLMKLRLNLDFRDLAYLFDVSPTTVSLHFKHMIELLHARFRTLIMWPSREIMRRTMPQCFRDAFGENITILTHCFELFIKKPCSLLKSRQSWSKYKCHHTMKYFIGITPQGTISFISEAWGGRVSDKNVIINSTFLDNIVPGDVVLADQGFLVEDQNELLNATLKIPAFTKGEKQLDPIKLESKRSIANIQKHLEGLISGIRQKFKILAEDRPIYSLSYNYDDPILGQIVTVCCALINIGSPITPS